jgi:glycosyltransferase involved in cell wall biosynthesis
MQVRGSINTPVLTILVPTYNRSESLECLLGCIRSAFASRSSDLLVYVSDNASTDSTSKTISRIRANWPELRYYRHESNVGPDHNFIHCVKQVTTRWFWFISDDDLPKPGVIDNVLQIIRQEEPSLLYMKSEWVNDTKTTKVEYQSSLNYLDLTPLQFTRSIHTWFTFISAFVVDRFALLDLLGTQSYDQYQGTNLVQLGWVLPLLRQHGKFIFVRDRCLLCTANNSGGYKLLTVFGVHFPNVVRHALSDAPYLARSIINGHLMYYLPSLVWGNRINPAGSHHSESPWPQMGNVFSRHILYWALIFPLGKMPFFVAFPIHCVWLIMSRFFAFSYLRGLR